MFLKDFFMCMEFLPTCNICAYRVWLRASDPLEMKLMALPCMCWGKKPQPLQEQQVFLTIELFSSPLPCISGQVLHWAGAYWVC